MIIGHERQIEYLKKVYERGTFAHAYLFFGPEHIGKLVVAKEWLKLFFPAGSLSGIEENQNPDVIYLSRSRLLVTENQKEIGIEDILELKRRAALSAYAGGQKFIIIDGAHDLSEEAQNSILKILEEPAGKTVFILITDSPDSLLPTIVSRSVPLRFTFVPDVRIRAYLEEKGILPEKSEKILGLASGRPGVAISFAEDKKFFEEERNMAEFFRKITGSDFLEQVIFSREISQEPEKLDKFLCFLLGEGRKKMFSGAADSNGFSALSNLRRVLWGRRLLRETNVNKKLLVENILLEI